MQIENIRPWQWAIIGAVLGVAYSGVLAYAGPWYDTGRLDTTDVTMVERVLSGRAADRVEPGLVAQYHAGQPVVRRLIVHPPIPGDGPRQWLTGEYYQIGPQPKDPRQPAGPMSLVEWWVPFKFPAAIPFAVKAGPARGNYAGVREYLAARHAVRGADFTYRYAWTEASAAQWTLPAVAGVLFVGVAWPLTLSAMSGVGLAKPPTVKKPKPVPVKSVPADPGVRAVLPPPLAVAPPPPPPQTEEERKRYGGEFYPVVKNTH